MAPAEWIGHLTATRVRWSRTGAFVMPNRAFLTGKVQACSITGVVRTKCSSIIKIPAVSSSCSSVTVKRKVWTGTRWTWEWWIQPYQLSTSTFWGDKWLETSGNHWSWLLLKLCCAFRCVRDMNVVYMTCFLFYCCLLKNIHLCLALGGSVKLGWYGTWNFF